MLAWGDDIDVVGSMKSEGGSVVARQQVGRVLEVETSESVVFHYELAGVGSRGIAAILDLVAISALILGEILLTFLVTAIVGRIIDRSIYLFTTWALAGLIVAVFITFWGYYIFGDVARNGQTWGKRRLGIRVVREDGSRVTVIDSVIRNLVRVIDLLPGNYTVGVASIMLSREARRIGDIAAGTVVIRAVKALSDFSPAGAHPEKTELVRDFLERRDEMTPEGRYQTASAILAALGEQPGTWDEPMIAGRLADLTGLR